MYLEFVLFVSFVFFAVLDVKCRQIKAYWFVGLAVTVSAYKIIFESSSIPTDVFMFGVSVLFMGIAFACRLFAKADLFGILILAFAVPTIGPIPTGIPLLLSTLILQNWAIIISNTAYNISDLCNGLALFEDTTNVRQGRMNALYWFFLARRRRESDRFVISAEKHVDKLVTLSIKRDSRLSHSTKYVFSAHPQFVYSTISYACLWFVTLSF